MNHLKMVPDTLMLEKLSMRARATWLLAGGFLIVLLSVMALIALRCGIKRGKLETVEYDFKDALSGKQRMVVYLPPNYPQDAPYPVLYLLHGAGDDETSWQKQGAADSILDRLYAEKKIVAMIVVMPNAQGRSSAFEQDLLEAVIPYVESHYATQRDGRLRAIAGVSLGGWQALSIGLTHTDRFAWVGGFSPALNDVLPANYSGQLKLLWLSCGDRDGLLEVVCEPIHKTLEERNIPHVWHVSPGEHEWPVWKNDFAGLHRSYSATNQEKMPGTILDGGEKVSGTISGEKRCQEPFRLDELKLPRAGQQQRRVVLDLDSLDYAAGFLNVGHALRIAVSRQSASRLNPITGTPQHAPGVPSSQPASNSRSANSSVMSVLAARITSKS